MTGSTRSPAVSVASGIPPARPRHTPTHSLLGLRRTSTAATTRTGLRVWRLPHGSGCPANGWSRRQHLRRLPPQRPPAHPPHARPDRASPGAARAPRHALRPAPPPIQRCRARPKTVYEVHLVIRGALADAARRGLVSRNVALAAHAPRLRSIPKVEQQAWSADELRAFLRAAAGHRLFPAFWVAAFTGMRRNELLGLRWDDFDPRAATLSINRGLIAVAYEFRETHEARPATPADASISTRPPCEVLVAWRHWQQSEQGHGPDRHRRWIFTMRTADPPTCHLASVRTHRSRRRRAGHPTARPAPHTWNVADQGRVPVKVLVSERLGHATPCLTIDTYQHVLPGS